MLWKFLENRFDPIVSLKLRREARPPVFHGYLQSITVSTHGAKKSIERATSGV